MAELLKKEKLIQLEKEMVKLGPRLTGNEAHGKFIDLLKNELNGYGYKVKSDHLSLKRWEAKSWSLCYTDNGNIINVSNISYYPYSGITDEKGVCGKLQYCGKNITPYLNVKDKIAIVKMSVFEASCGLVFKKRECVPSDFTPPKKLASPVVSSFVLAPMIKQAKTMGAKAVICIMVGCSEDNAKYQYLPFVNKYQDIPALWVGEKDGEKIIRAAKNGEEATLVLTGELIDNEETETFYAVLKGKNDKEAILINTHTDGTNAFEENAGIGLLSLAKYFSEKPLNERDRTLVFSFITGHFQLNQFGNSLKQATNRFLSAHKNFWDGKDGHRKAVAGLCMEHLGCTEWRDDSEHSKFIKVDDVDPELVYVANNKLAEIYKSALINRKFCKTLILKPKNLVHFGEGQPMYRVGIPTISLCPGPDYLCNVAPDGYIEKINYDLMEEQILTFKKLIEILDKKTPDEIGKKDGFSFGFIF